MNNRREMDKDKSIANPYYAGVDVPPVSAGVGDGAIASFAQMLEQQPNVKGDGGGHPLVGLHYVDSVVCPVCGQYGPGDEFGKILRTMHFGGQEFFLMERYRYLEDEQAFDGDYKYLGVVNTTERFYDDAEEMERGIYEWASEHDECTVQANQ